MWDTLGYTTARPWPCLSAGCSLPRHCDCLQPEQILYIQLTLI